MNGIRVSAFIATSLDGFIARECGELDWLDAANATVPNGEDCGYADFFSTIDVLVMGRKSFEKVLSFGVWPYGETKSVVLSHSAVTFPNDLPKSISSSTEEPSALLERLSREGASHIYLDGGVTIQSFLRLGLVDEITITVIPVLLGQGIPLFGPLEQDVSLNLISSKSYDFGFVQTKYGVSKDQGR
jgi:dihydrofolate reductase